MHLQIGAEHVAATLVGGWPRRRAAQSRRPFDATAARLDEGRGALDAIVAALTELEATAPLARAPLDVAVDDAHVHLDVVNGDFRANSDAELERIAHACIAELLGPEADGHAVRWTLQAGERSLLIAALPTWLGAAVQAAATEHGLALRSLQPAFCHRWNAAARDLARGPSVFVTASQRHATVACVEGRAITAISTGPWSPGERGESADGLAVAMALLDAHVDRLVAASGVELSSVASFRLVAPEAPHLKAPPRWTVVAAREVA